MKVASRELRNDTTGAHDVPVVTQDTDFDVLAGLGGFRVVHI